MSGNLFGGGNAGNLFANNKPAQSNPQQGNIFGNNNAGQQQAPNTANQQPTTAGGNLFTNTTTPSQASNPFTANQPKPQAPVGLFGSQQPQTQATQPQQQPATNLFNKPTEAAKPETNLFGNPTQTGGGIFGQNKTQQPKKAANLFGVNPTSNTTGTGGVTGGGLFANNNNQQQPATTTPQVTQPPPATTTNPTTTTTTNPITTPATTTQPAANNIFGVNPANKVTPASNPTTTTPPTGTNLFNNPTNPASQTTNPLQQQQKPASQTGGGIFNTGTQPSVTSPQTQTASTTNPLQTQQSTTNPITNPQQQAPQNEGQKRFDMVASKSVKQFITSTRQQMQQMYSDLQKYSTNLLRYQKDREQNVQIFKNFEEMKPQFVNNVELNLRVLANMEQQQNEIESHLNLIYNSINPERVDHPLLQCLLESQQLSQQVLMLQAQSEAEGVQDIANNPSNEQLLLLYSTLDKLETDVDRMNEILNITFSNPNLNQNNPLYGNYSNYR